MRERQLIKDKIMTNTTIASANTVTSTNSTQGTTMKYSKLVNGLTVSKAINLFTDEAALNASPMYNRLTDKDGFEMALECRVKSILLNQEIDMTENNNLKSLAKSYAKEAFNNVTGMVKSNLKRSQAEERQKVALFEQTLAMGTIANQILTDANVYNDLIINKANSNIFGAIAMWYGKNFGSKEAGSIGVATYNWAVVKGPEAKAAFIQAVNNIKALKAEAGAQGVKYNKDSGMFVKPVSNGLLVSVTKENPLCKRLDLNTSYQVSFRITPDTFSSEGINKLSRVLLADESGVYKLQIDGDIEVKDATHTGLKVYLNSMTKSLWILETLVLISKAKLQTESLDASPTNYLVAGRDGHGIIKKGNPLDNESFYAFAEAYGFFGMSSPDTLHKGVVKATENLGGFFHRGNNLVSYTVEGTAAKALARSVKLGSKVTGNVMVLDTVWCVVDTMGSEKVEKQLSTGNIHVPTSNLRKHGQCRVVSGTANGGIKATLSPVAFIDSFMDLAGISLMSFSAMKAGFFGIKQLMKEDFGNNFSNVPTKEVVLQNGGTVKVIELSNVEVQITNNYTIQQFKPFNREALLLNSEEATKAQTKRAMSKGSLIEEDLMFLDFILDIRDTVYGGNLENTLKDLQASGDIVRKGRTTNITPSEYDLLALSEDKSAGIKMINTLTDDPLNSEKGVEYQRAFQALTGNYRNMFTVNAMTMYENYISLCNTYGLNHNVTLGSFLPRDFLVDLNTQLFGIPEGSSFEWVSIQLNGVSVTVPMGEFMSGSFHKTTSVFEEAVSVTGFMAKLLKYIPYGADMVANTGAIRNNTWSQFCANVKAELQCELLGKDLGRMKATGLYGVMAPAWWSNDIAKVFFNDARAYSKNKTAVIAKQPLLFLEALAKVKIASSLPKQLTKDISSEDLKTIEFAMSSTIFCPEEMMVYLQNDADGDLVRLTWHDTDFVDFFQGSAVKETNFTHKWHQAYVAKERDFTSVNQEVVRKSMTNKEILDACKSASVCKGQVGLFTSLAQKFGQLQEQLGYSIDSVQGKAFRLLLNTFVQEFAMNDIKHSDDGEVITKLPEYFLTSNVGKKAYQGWKAPMIDFLENTLDVDMADYGFEGNVDFATKFYNVMVDLAAAIKDEGTPNGAVMVGKGYELRDVRGKCILETWTQEDLDGSFDSVYLLDHLVRQYI